MISSCLNKSVGCRPGVCGHRFLAMLLWRGEVKKVSGLLTAKISAKTLICRIRDVWNRKDGVASNSCRKGFANAGKPEFLG